MPKPERRQVDAAERLQQGVVPAAAADRAQLALRVEQLEDDARVVRQAAHDLEVDRHPVEHAEPVEVVEVAPKLGDRRLHLGDVAELAARSRRA